MLTSNNTIPHLFLESHHQFITIQLQSSASPSASPTISSHSLPLCQSLLCQLSGALIPQWQSLFLMKHGAWLISSCFCVITLADGSDDVVDWSIHYHDDDIINMASSYRNLILIEHSNGTNSNSLSSKRRVQL